MYVNKKKMTTLEKVLYTLAFVVLLGLFIFLGTREYDTIETNPSFHRDFNLVSDQNHFKYVKGKDILNVFVNKKDAIVFLGFPENIWSNQYASMIHNAAESAGIKEILYYNFFQDRQNNNSTYEELLKYIGNNVIILDQGSKEIYAPCLIMIKNGEIVYFDNETAIMNGTISPNAYWTSDKIGLKTAEFEVKMKVNFIEEKKDDENKTEQVGSSTDNTYDTSFLTNASLSDINKKIANGESVLIVNASSGCGPCRSFMPIMKSVFTENKIKGFLLDRKYDEETYNTFVSDNEDLKYALSRTPALIYIKNKKVIFTQVGSLDEAKLISLLKSKEVMK